MLVNIKPIRKKPPTKMLKVMLEILKMVGLHPYQRGILPNVLFLITVISTGCNLIPMMMEVLFNWQGVVTLKKIYMLPAVFMLLIKAVVMQRFSPNLVEILDSLDMFWATNKFDETTKNTADKLLLIMGNFMLYFLLISYSTIALVITATILNGNNILIFEGYDLCDYNENIPCWIAMLVWQIFICLAEVLPLILGFDNLFLGVLSYMYIAAGLLQTAFDNFVITLPPPGQGTIARWNLKEIVDQHNIVFRCLKQVDEYSSTVLSIQFLSSLGSLILNMFTLRANGMPPKLEDLKFAIIWIWHFVQLMLYCMASTKFYDRMQNLSQSVYNVAWYTKDGLLLRRDLSLIIMRIETMPGLRLGKMIDLNMNLLLSVLKTSFSIYTLLQSLA